MKYIGWIFLIIVIAGIAVYYYLNTFIAKVSFQIAFNGLDLSGISLENVFSGNGTVGVQLNAKITNRNNVNINLSNFHIFIYYNGTMIAQTTENTNNLAKISIPANGTIDVLHDVTVFLNSAFLQAGRDLKSGNEVRFDYDTNFNVYGFPYSYKDYFTYRIGA